MTAQDGPDAVANANRYTSYESGMCLKWVRGPCWEIGSLYGSAIEAWNGAKYKHPGDRTPPVGAPLFYAGGKYGHVVIAKPGGAGMRSTDCKSGGRVSDAAIAWVEDNWNYDYLGWAEDLNGVRLPLYLGDEDDMPLSNDDVDRVAEAVWKKLLQGQDSAPDGRYAGATLSGIRNLAERIAKKVGA